MNHRKWNRNSVCHMQFVDVEAEHNVLYEDWKKVSLELERFVVANGALCDRIAFLESDIEKFISRGKETLDENNRLNRELDEARQALKQARQALKQNTRVPFLDEHIEAMARAANDAYANFWISKDWPKTDIPRDQHWRMWDKVGEPMKESRIVMIRAALAAGGLEPCAVPLNTERASDDELIPAVGTALNIPYDEKFSPYSERGWEYTRAVRARVEAPLLAEIQRLKSEPTGHVLRDRLENAERIIENQRMSLRQLHEARERDAVERMKLESEFVSLTAERDSARAELEAVLAGVAADEDYCKMSEGLVKALSDYGLLITQNRKYEYSLRPINSNPSPAPTPEQVEALARVLHKAQDGFYCRYGDHATKFDDYAPLWLACARAAYAHIGRVPVGAELDVHPDQLELYKWVTMPDGGYTYAAQQAIDLCRSRIRPVYECKECARLKDRFSAMQEEQIAMNDKILAALESVKARSALGG